MPVANLHQVSDNPACTFHELPMTEQLFLWTIRHLVYSASERTPVCTEIQQTFEMTGLPMIPTLINDLLGAISRGAKRSILVNGPNGIELLEDEQYLTACLRALSGKPPQCGCQELTDLVEPEALEGVIHRFGLIANILTHHDWHDISQQSIPATPSTARATLH